MTTLFSSDPAVLVLEDGTRHVGRAYGAHGTTLGEVVFATGMTGYQETLTDPSYAGQIVLQTAPHIGNTGMNSEDPESRRIWVSGYIVRDPSRVVSNWRADQSLDDALVDDGVVGISGIDTRAVTRHIRSAGSMRGGIFSGEAAGIDEDEQLRLVREAPEMAGQNLSASVSVSAAEVTPAQGERIGNLAVLDLGVKQATIDNLAARGFEVHVLPQDVTIEASGRSTPSPSSTPTAPATPRPRATTSSCCAACSMTACRSSASASATSCSAARSGSTRTSCPSATAASTSPCSTSRPAASRSRRTTTGSPSRPRWRGRSTAPTATAASR